MGAGHWAESSRAAGWQAGWCSWQRTAVSRLDSWTGHTMLQLARTSTTATHPDSAVDTVVQQRSRAPRGNRETRAPSLKVAKPLLLVSLTVSRAKARARRPWVCTKHVVQKTRRHHRRSERSRELAGCPPRAGLVGTCLLPAALLHRAALPHHCRAARGREARARRRAVTACVFLAPASGVQ